MPLLFFLLKKRFEPAGILVGRVEMRPRL